MKYVKRYIQTAFRGGGQPLKPHYSKRFRGFTLAETLITLGIIGIVGAMTIPALSANIQKRTHKHQLQVGYSKMYNALEVLKIQDKFLPMCCYGTGCSVSSICQRFFNKFASQLKLVKACYGNAYQDGCIPKYKGRDDIYRLSHPNATDQEVAQDYEGCSGFTGKNILKKSYAYLVADGMIIFTYFGATYPIFVLDVNGKTGPNKWGHDLFMFTFNSKDGRNIVITPVNSGCMPVEKGGVFTKYMLDD